MVPWADLAPREGAAPAEGGWGLVFRATYSRRGRPAMDVAVKLLKTRAVKGAVLERLEAEARTMWAARDAGHNEYVVRLVGLCKGAATDAWKRALGDDLGLCKGGAQGGGEVHLYGLCMRWEDGGTLDQLLHKESGAPWGASTAERLTLCTQIAQGLLHVHAHVVHGDIKPENILLNRSNLHPRLTDFGFAELRDRDAERTHLHSDVSTVEAAVEKRGTWVYMAPEMYASMSAPAAKATRSSDVFAFSTLCLEVLSDVKPWQGYDPASRLAELRAGRVLPAACEAGIRQDTPPAVRQVLMACLLLEREKRPRLAVVHQVLSAEAARLSAGHFDVFLSHCWTPAPNSAHHPLTTEIYSLLIEEGHRVWVDTLEMGSRLDSSMENGIKNSSCVVALLSERYGTRPNCKLELELSRKHGRHVVPCMVEPSTDWFPSKELQTLVCDTDRAHFVDFRAAALVDWGAPVAKEERARVLTRHPDAWPKLKRFIKEAINAGAGGDSSTSGGGASGGGARGGGARAPALIVGSSTAAESPNSSNSSSSMGSSGGSGSGGGGGGGGGRGTSAALEATQGALLLPPGWESRESTSQRGKTYFVNLTTKKTQFERPTAPAEAPPGWTLLFSTSSGKPYYSTLKGDKSLWVYPSAEALGAEAAALPLQPLSTPASSGGSSSARSLAASQEAVLPPGWIEHKSTKTGRIYYENRTTKKTQFEVPTAPAEAPPGWQLKFSSSKGGKPYYEKGVVSVWEYPSNSPAASGSAPGGAQAAAVQLASASGCSAGGGGAAQSPRCVTPPAPAPPGPSSSWVAKSGKWTKEGH